MPRTTAGPKAAAYPVDLERDVELRDGTRVHVRPVRADDAELLIGLYGRLSHQTAYQRFFSVMQRLPPQWAQYLAAVDYVQRLALVVSADARPATDLIAVARYEPAGEPDTAEIAFVVEDGWQNRGLGTILLGMLLEAAVARGIRQFRAFVLADNRRMLDLLARFTDIRRRTMESGVVDLLFTARPRVDPLPAPTGS